MHLLDISYVHAYKTGSKSPVAMTMHPTAKLQGGGDKHATGVKPPSDCKKKEQQQEQGTATLYMAGEKYRSSPMS